MASVGRFKVWETLLCSLFELLRELTMTEVAGTHMVLSNPVLEFESITQVKKSCLFSWFITNHQGLSSILLDTTTCKDFHNPVLFVNTILTQVDEEEAELFLTPGLTWTTSGNFAQAEVIISFLFVELFLSCGLGKSPRASIWWMLWIFLKNFIKL